MSSSVLTVSKKTIQEMKVFYQANLKNNPPQYSEFSAKVNGTTITAYSSGKVVFQGKNAEVEASKWTEGTEAKQVSSNPPKKNSNSLPSDFKSWSVVGSDETGTGSYFGPLIVCASYVSSDKIELVKELGTRDSKNLNAKQIKRIASDLRMTIPYSLQIVSPQKYNEVIKNMNQNEMKAVLHNQALMHVIDKIAPEKPDAILVDQFTPPSSYLNYIKNQKRPITNSIYFATQGEQKHLSVAAASIIARDSFNQKLKEYSKKIGITLPSGAHTPSDLQAAKVLKKGGINLLSQVAKLHFANTQKAQKLLNL